MILVYYYSDYHSCPIESLQIMRERYFCQLSVTGGDALKAEQCRRYIHQHQDQQIECKTSLNPFCVSLKGVIALLYAKVLILFLK